MTWVNIPLEFLVGSDFRGSEPTDRATWLSLLAYCHAEENGGRIVGAARWKDRQWMMVCAVFLSEVQSECNLWAWDGDDLIVAHYPKANEDAAKARREIGRLNAEKRWAKEKAQKEGAPIATPNAPSNAKGKGNEGKKKEENETLDDSLGRSISEIVVTYANAAQWKVNPETDKAALRSIQSGKITVEELRAKVAAIAEVITNNPRNNREYNATPLVFFTNEQWRNAPASFKHFEKSKKAEPEKIREPWQIKGDVETIEAQIRAIRDADASYEWRIVATDPTMPEWTENKKFLKDHLKPQLEALKQKRDQLKKQLVAAR